MNGNTQQRGIGWLNKPQPCRMESSEGADVACGKPATIVLQTPEGLCPLCDECLLRTEAGRAAKLIVDVIRARVREDVRMGKLSLRAGDN